MGVRFREERGLECGWKALSGDTKLNLTSSPHTCRKQQSREALSHSHSLTVEAGDGGGEGGGVPSLTFPYLAASVARMQREEDGPKLEGTLQFLKSRLVTLAPAFLTLWLLHLI